jgi:hypothetical protein
LIGGDEEVELAFCPAQEFTVFDALPTTIADCYALITPKDIAQRHWQAFVQQDSHSFGVCSQMG